MCQSDGLAQQPTPPVKVDSPSSSRPKFRPRKRSTEIAPVSATRDIHEKSENSAGSLLTFQTDLRSHLKNYVEL
ncbi:hypothetical protein J6590_014596 [Homalodisca vitripennis]|nr:hypothetical protein J6590_014596 [Homalodisca vitripennis]